MTTRRHAAAADLRAGVVRLPGGDGVMVVEGDAFMIADALGDVRPGTADGFYHRDTRFLSGLRLEVDGRPPELLTSAPVDAFSARMFLRPAGSPWDQAPVVIERRRFIGDGVHEDLVVVNHGQQMARVTVRIAFEADFADLFEVKQSRATGAPSKVEAAIRPDEGVIELARRRQGADRAVVLRVMPDADPEITAGAIVYNIEVAARGAWRTCLDIVPVHEGRGYEPRCRCDAFGLLDNPMAQRARRWQASFPQLETDHDTLEHVYRRTVADLGALRVASPDGSDRTVVAAGMPWFMTLFGRDALLTGYMVLPFAPDLAIGSLEVLAALQGERIDRDSGEEPGKILHEVRAGPLTVGRRRSYGSIDATLLFVILAAEVHRWGVAPQAVQRLVPTIERCVDWALRHGDVDGDGFIEYHGQPAPGLVNQAWKDSGDAIQSADGRPAQWPIAAIEVQGYLVEALRAGAEVLEAHGASADRVAALRRQAAETADRIVSDFTVATSPAGHDHLALALDGHKQPVDALASNMGHLLWNRAVRPDTAQHIADQLLDEPLFAGWGVRTLAASNAGFLPVSYHRGSIWPHDNAIIAHGLARYGLTAPMLRISLGLLRAARAFDHALPELFAGIADDGHGFPVAYPAANRPQAWATAAPLLLLRAWLGLEADVPHGRLWICPAIPDGVDRLVLRGLAIGNALIDISWSHGDLDVDGLPPNIELIRQRQPLDTSIPGGRAAS